MSDIQAADLSKPRYDQSTYWGRLRHFSQVTSPLTLFASSSQLEGAKKLVDAYKAGNVDPKTVDVEGLWKAKTLVDSTYHPDTGEKVFILFRLSAFVPMNMALVAGMLMPNPSMKSIVFWQWANQSMNVAINYANANKTTEMNVWETGAAYAAAVTASVSIALGLNEGVKRLPSTFSPVLRTVFSRLVPFAAVAGAGTVNVFTMRLKEIRDGIEVKDEEGNSYGKSKKAGLSAVTQVAVTRTLTAVPVMIFPPLAQSIFERTRLYQRRPWLGTPVNFAFIAASLMTALPAAVAMFPQRPVVLPASLEERYHDLTNRRGERVTRLMYNKGL